MDGTHARIAALNNAVWCNAVCAAHGPAGRFAPGWWSRDQPSPPFYPNLITLDPDVAPTAAIAEVQRLGDLPSLGRFAVKDSFGRLDLSARAFTPLFDAHWLWLADALPATDTGPLRWAVVRDAPALAAWEAAWRQQQEPIEGLGGSPRIFAEGLLREPAVSFLAGYADGTLTAGTAITRSHSVAGLACSFGAGLEPVELQRTLARRAQALFPGTPLVGYESGQALRDARAAGYRQGAALRVWLRDAGLQ
jgi:hypothetical protein